MYVVSNNEELKIWAFHVYFTVCNVTSVWINISNMCNLLTKYLACKLENWRHGYQRDTYGK